MTREARKSIDDHLPLAFGTGEAMLAQLQEIPPFLVGCPAAGPVDLV
ncbi:hypothetical protein PoMZ_11510 [Pyricularia oryzae]|uniref:Uncharacterized protein n=1 Tax=Pyricularia oryzae TaxID=318829 RepID=A0A4P7NKI6_PYROR|nr:hypothetical protein PoMZ_11510 [Pyricularia oryzae]